MNGTTSRFIQLNGALLDLSRKEGVTYTRMLVHKTLVFKKMKVLLVAVGLALVSSETRGAQDDQVIRAEVEAVLINVLVTDRNGRPIAGLERENFQIFEDKVEQQIGTFFPVNAPFSVVLLLDTSYSTYGKLAPIQDSAIEFVEQIHPQDEVMVISFDDEVYLETDFTSNKDAAARAIKTTRTGQSTKLYDSVFLGMEEIRQRPYRKVMVVFSDGIDTTSSDSSRGETIRVAKESDTTIYAIQFDTRNQMLMPRQAPIGTPGTIPGRNPIPIGIPTPLPGPIPGGGGRSSRRQVEAEYGSGRAYLKQLASVTGGDLYEASQDLLNLSAIFAQIAEEMRSLYGISYVSSNPRRDGKFRKIVVRVDVPNARVRTRKGYRSKGVK